MHSYPGRRPQEPPRWRSPNVAPNPARAIQATKTTAKAVFDALDVGIASIVAAKNRWDAKATPVPRTAPTTAGVIGNGR